MKKKDLENKFIKQIEIQVKVGIDCMNKYQSINFLTFTISELEGFKSAVKCIYEKSIVIEIIDEKIFILKQMRDEFHNHIRKGMSI